jgi:hypothetical protein
MYLVGVENPHKTEAGLILERLIAAARGGAENSPVVRKVCPAETQIPPSCDAPEYQQPTRADVVVPQR